MLFFFSLSLSKARPSDADAQAKYKECDKTVKRLAFERAISVKEKEAEPLEARLTTAINFLKGMCEDKETIKINQK